MGVFIYLYYKVAWVLVIFKCPNVCHFVENTHYQYSVSANKGFLQSGGNKYQHIINQIGLQNVRIS